MYTTSGLAQTPGRARAGAHPPQGSLIHLRGSEPGAEVIRRARGSLQRPRSRLTTASASPLKDHLTRDHEGLDGQLDACLATPSGPWRPRPEPRRAIATGKRLRNRV
jgi:hypothetical protein